jgi:hypothetical protein
MPRIKNEPVVLEILEIIIRAIAAAATLIPKLLPSAVWVTKDLITTRSKASEIGVARTFANSTIKTPILEISQAAAAIIARLRIRIASGKSFEPASRIKKPIAIRRPINVVAEIICKVLTKNCIT